MLISTHLYIDFINKKLAVLCGLLVFVTPWNEVFNCDDKEKAEVDIICTVYIDVTVEGLQPSSDGVTVCLMSRGQQLVSRAQPSAVRRLQQQQPSSDPHCKGQPEQRPGRQQLTGLGTAHSQPLQPATCTGNTLHSEYVQGSKIKSMCQRR